MVSLSGVSVGQIAKVFTHEFVFSYGPSGVEIVSGERCVIHFKLFQSLCGIMSVDNQFTVSCHSQTTSQVKRYNRTLKAVIKSYLSSHLLHKDLSTTALAYAYSHWLHTLTSLAPFDLFLPLPLPSLPILSQAMNTRTTLDTYSTTSGNGCPNQSMKPWVSSNERRMDTSAAKRNGYDANGSSLGKEIASSQEWRAEMKIWTLRKVAAETRGPHRDDNEKSNRVVLISEETLEWASKEWAKIAPRQLFAN